MVKKIGEREEIKSKALKYRNRGQASRLTQREAEKHKGNCFTFSQLFISAKQHRYSSITYLEGYKGLLPFFWMSN